MTLFKGFFAQLIGTSLTRIVVPLWILAGAVFKLVEASPRALPKASILNPANHYEINLYVLLALLIFLEFFAISVMIFLRPFARSMAIFMLACFCLILAIEIQSGASSCGCLGSFSPSPWTMLSIDGFLLLGTLIFAPAKVNSVLPSKLSIIGASLGIVIGASVSFGIILPAGLVPENNQTVEIAKIDPSDPILNPSPKPLKGYWMVESIEGWIGKSWRELEIFQFMPVWPENMDDQKRYVVIYSRTCEDCEDMFWNDLVKPLEPPVIAIEIPADKETLTSPNAWEIPETNCILMNLPLGTDWIISSPMSLRLENGVVTCAEEGDHKGCLELDP